MTENLDNRFLAQHTAEDTSDQWLRDLVGSGGGTQGSSAGTQKKTKSPGAPQPASSSGGSSGGDSSGSVAPEYDAPESPRPLPETAKMVARGAWAVAKDIGEGVVVEGVPAVYDGARAAVLEGNRTASLFFDWAHKTWSEVKNGVVSGTIDAIAPLMGMDPKEAKAAYDQKWDPFNEVNTLFKSKYGRDMVPSDFNLIRPVFEALPDAEQETYTGAIIQGISNYITGNAIMGPLAKAAKIPVNVWGQAVRDSLNGAIFFDERMERLSNLLPEGPVRDFMIADPAGEQVALNKLKMAFEGGLIGGIAGGTFEGFKWTLRTWKAAMAHVPPPKLVVARRMPDGTVREGQPGDLHPMLVDEGEDFNAALNENMGFVVPGTGKFMTRAESLEWVKKNEPKIAKDGEKRGLYDNGGRTGFRYLEAGKYQEIQQRIDRMKQLMAEGWRPGKAADKAGLPRIADLDPANDPAFQTPEPHRTAESQAFQFDPRKPAIYVLDGKELTVEELATLTDEQIDRLQIFEHDGTKQLPPEAVEPPAQLGADRPDSPLSEAKPPARSMGRNVDLDIPEPQPGETGNLVDFTKKYPQLFEGLPNRIDEQIDEHMKMYNLDNWTPEQVQGVRDQVRRELLGEQWTFPTGQELYDLISDRIEEAVGASEAAAGEGAERWPNGMLKEIPYTVEDDAARYVLGDEASKAAPLGKKITMTMNGDNGPPKVGGPAANDPGVPGGGGGQRPPAGGGGGRGNGGGDEPPSSSEGAPDDAGKASMELRDYLQLHGGEDDFYLGLLHENPQVIREAVSQLKRQLAREANTPGEMVPISGRALKINLDRIETTEDVKLLLADMEHLMGPMDDIPVSDVTKNALKMHTGVDDYLKGAVEPALLSGGHQMRLRILLTSSAEGLLDLAKKAYSVHGTKVDKARFVKAYTIHRNLQEFALTQQIGVERAMGAYKVKARSDGEAMTQINELLGTLGESNIDEMIEKLAQLDSPEKVSVMAKTMSESMDRDIIQAVWYNLLLSSPDTLAANILGTGANTLWQIPERFLAAGVARVPGLHKPTQLQGALARNLGDERVFFQEGMAQLYGLINGTMNGLKMAGKSLRSGRPTFEGLNPIEGGRANLGPITAALPRNAAAQWLNAMVPTNIMRASDDFFKWVNFSGELEALALRHAFTMGKDERWARDLLRHPPAWMLQAAKKKAMDTTFNSPLQGWINHFAKAMDDFKIPLPHFPSVEIPVGRILMPFIRTPTNLMKWSYDRSLAAYWPNNRIRQELAQGGATRDLAIAKIATGHAMMLSFASLILSGVVNGGGPQNPIKNSAWQNAGNMPYSIKVGDKRHKFDRLQPFGDLLRWMADAVDVVQFAQEEDADLIAQSVIFGIAEALQNKTYFQSLSDFFLALDDSNYEGTKWSNRMASSFVPAGVKDIERAMDPTIRQGRDILDAVKAGIPELSEDLEPNLNVWGEKQYQPSYDNLFMKIFWPGGSKKVDPMPIETFVWEKRVNIEKVNRVQRWERNGIEVKLELSPKQLNHLVRLGTHEIKDPATGLGMVDYLNALVKGELRDNNQQLFNQSSDHFKGQIVKKVVREFRDAAKEQFILDEGLEGRLEEAFNRKAQELAPEIVGGQ